MSARVLVDVCVTGDVDDRVPSLLVRGRDAIYAALTSRIARVDERTGALVPVVDGVAAGGFARAPSGALWAWFDGGCVRVDDDVHARIALPIDHQRTRTICCAALDDGFVIAASSLRDANAAHVVRVDGDGRVRWRTPIPAPTSLRGYVAVIRRDEGWQPRDADAWQPRAWRLEALTISGERAFVVGVDEGSGIGLGFGIALADGALVYTTPPAPHGEIAPYHAGSGSFLVGVQGYGAFETRHIDDDGVERARWPSHGMFVARGERVFAVELENVLPSRSHFAELLPGGSVLHGAHLPGYSTSRVVDAADGSVLFWRDDALVRATPDRASIERVYETGLVGNQHRPWVRELAGACPGVIAFTWHHHIDRGGRVATEHRFVVVDVG